MEQGGAGYPGCAAVRGIKVGGRRPSDNPGVALQERRNDSPCMHTCHCTEIHTPRRIVLTGGPGAGKTAILELIRMAFCHHVRILPEAAGVIFGGGFPRSAEGPRLRAAQRAIYHVQRQMEACCEGENLAVVLCDRGTLDGVAYWPGPGSFWEDIGSDPAAEMARYEAVIHLRTPSEDGGYDHSNPLRIESADEAHRIDLKIAELWSGHPRRYEIPTNEDFLEKAREVMAILRAEVPSCCPSSLSRLVR
jgi:predicted ATPase